MKTPQTHILELGYNYVGRGQMNDQSADVFIKQGEFFLSAIYLYKDNTAEDITVIESKTYYDEPRHWTEFIWGKEPITTEVIPMENTL